AAGRAGSLALGRGGDRRGRPDRRRGDRQGRCRPLPAAGGDRPRPRPGAAPRRHRLERDPRPVRAARTGRAGADGGFEPGRRCGDGRRSRAGAGAARRGRAEARRPPSRARGPRPPARAGGRRARRPRRVQPRRRTDREPPRAALPDPPRGPPLSWWRLTRGAPPLKISPSLLYFSDPSSLDHDPRDLMPGHPESPPRLVAIERRLEAEGWLGWERRGAPVVTTAELELVHTSRHIAGIRELSEAGGGAIDVETYDGPESFQAATHAVGGAAALARALLAGEAPVGLSALRPPGHHAEPERAMGFCLFNSVAVAAALAIAELGASRVLILD